MTSPSKVRGAKWERDIVDFLNGQGWEVERTRSGWADDRGDIHGVPGVCIEAKDQKKHALGSWADERDVETINAKADIGFLVVKRLRKASPAHAYWIMSGYDAVTLLKKAGYA